MSHIAQRAQHLCMLLFIPLIFCQLQALSQGVSQRVAPVLSINSNYFHNHSEQNLASRAFGNHSSLFATYENQFFLKELMTAEVGLHYHYLKNLFSVQIAHFGYGQYGEMTSSVGYAKLFGTRFAVALQFHYLWEHAYQYPFRHSFAFDFSFYTCPTEKFGLGVSVYNPARLKYGFTEEVIPTTFTLNAHWTMSSRLLCYVDVEKSFPGYFSFLLGLDYKIWDFYLSGAVGLQQMQFSCKLYKKNFCMKMQMDYFYKIGFVPTLSLSYLF